jgi:hypothetical protein
VVKLIDPDATSCGVMFLDGEFKMEVTATMIRMPKTKSALTITFADDSQALKEKRKFPLRTRVMANPHNEWTKAYAGKIEHFSTDGKCRLFLYSSIYI